MRYEFTIESWTPTPLNKLIGCHWATKHRRRKSDDKNVAGFAWLAKIPHATGPRSVKLVIGLAKGQRGYDPDAYQKSALDALVN